MELGINVPTPSLNDLKKKSKRYLADKLKN